MSQEEVTMATMRSLYLPDFITGILAGLALNRVSSLSLRENRLDQAFSRLNEAIAHAAEKEHLAVKFRFRTHPIHQDSTLLQQALYEAAKRDLISLDNPEFQSIRLKITTDEAPAYLEGLPGSVAMYRQLAALLVKNYQETSDQPEQA
jgi:hypothetical protein